MLTRRSSAQAALTLSILFASAVCAQTSSSPGAGHSTGASPSSPTSSPAADLDLPLERPVYQPPAPPTPTPGPAPVPAPTPPPPPPDDPRDGPPPTIFGEEIVSENDTLVYVIDRSGSMEEDEQSYVDLDGRRRAGNRMERAKVEISRSILGLASNFRFDIVGYDCATVVWRGQLVPADDANKQSALAWVRALEPQGATGTGPAVSLGLATRENRLVVLLTDGAPNCGVPVYDDTGGWDVHTWEVIGAHRRMIRSNNTQGARINVFGIAAWGIYRRFCQDVASDSGGSYTDVP